MTALSAEQQGVVDHILARAQRKAPDDPAFVEMIRGQGGSGKTTLINALLKAWLEEKRMVCLTAFTGKAVSVLYEKTNHYEHRHTINSLLELDDLEKYATACFIVDEFSMVCKVLMARLAKAFPRATCFVWVGDESQLLQPKTKSLMTTVLASEAVKPHTL